MYLRSGKYLNARSRWVVRNDRKYAEWVAARPYLGELHKEIMREIRIVDRITRPRTVCHELSRQLIGDIPVYEGKCHRNAIAVLKAHPELRERLQYVEGFCSAGALGGNKMTGGQHSWLMLDDVIIEVTPTYEESTLDDYFPVRLWRWRWAAGAGDIDAGTVWHSRHRKIVPMIRAAMQRYKEMHP